MHPAAGWGLDAGRVENDELGTEKVKARARLLRGERNVSSTCQDKVQTQSEDSLPGPRLFLCLPPPLWPRALWVPPPHEHTVAMNDLERLFKVL